MPEETKTKTAEQTSSQPVKATNCVICNKPLKRIRQYYRNGKFYCSKRCYKKTKSKGTDEQAKS